LRAFSAAFLASLSALRYSSTSRFSAAVSCMELLAAVVLAVVFPPALAAE